jgi:D-sedoheptulose 7-phosphate isomerase
MIDFIKNEFENISNNFKKLKLSAEEIATVIEICVTAIKNGNKIIFCGNGGSAADAQHLAAELIGRYKLNRPAINSIALTANTSILTAVANDFGYETIFERQVEGLGKPGDVLIGISTSGNSKNVVLAIEKARSIGIKTVSFTGFKGGKMKEISDHCINVPSDITNNIQEMHIAVGHLICGQIEVALEHERSPHARIVS